MSTLASLLIDPDPLSKLIVCAGLFCCLCVGVTVKAITFGYLNSAPLTLASSIDSLFYVENVVGLINVPIVLVQVRAWCLNYS